MRRWLRSATAFALVAALAFTVLGAAGRPVTDTSIQGAIHVYSTSSLQNVMLEIGNAFRARYPNASVISSFAGTAEMREHLEQGANADVFVSADTATSALLFRHGLLLAPRVIARGRVGVIARAGGPVTRLQDLAKPGVRLLIGAPNTPAGRYATQVLDRMARARGLGKSYVQEVRANLVDRVKSARDGVLRVAKGDADACFAYATDAEMSKIKIVPVEIPDSLQAPVLFSAAVVRATSAPELATRFTAWLGDSFARARFERHGFKP